MKHSRKRSNIVPLTIDPRATNALKYKSVYCEWVVDCAKRGEFPEQWCARIEISLSTMYNWANRYREFDEACQFAWTALTSFWTREVVAAARGKQADTKALLQIVQKRFPDTWGHVARNTHVSFPSKSNEKQESSTATPERDF